MVLIVPVLVGLSGRKVSKATWIGALVALFGETFHYAFRCWQALKQVPVTDSSHCRLSRLERAIPATPACPSVSRQLTLGS